MFKKNLILVVTLFVASFFMTGMGWTQKKDTIKVKPTITVSNKDSLSLKTKSDSLKTRSQAKKLKGFIDKNANGIDDRMEAGIGKGKQKRKMDRFIDQNGDGICDGRESAFGIKKAFRKRRGHRKF